MAFSCCLDHDCCYMKLSGKCYPTIDYYEFTSHNGDITCAQVVQNSTKPTCAGHVSTPFFLAVDPGSWCWICECNRAAALCFQRNLNSYDEAVNSSDCDWEEPPR
ncbi:acidic phospholipase A2 BA2-like [Sphaerodactylus townsendi]|uniref:acidic phospholipase A2 BA2-like n=1 Tax=Sphaerodactylus townsendi TaxID=933632 RepID=UPI0020266904|nr:acidic phospholipase A2 BA2-like [Sphaerodactylus townsendi]